MTKESLIEDLVERHKTSPTDEKLHVSCDYIREALPPIVWPVCKITRLSTMNQFDVILKQTGWKLYAVLADACILTRLP